MYQWAARLYMIRIVESLWRIQSGRGGRKRAGPTRRPRRRWRRASWQASFVRRCRVAAARPLAPASAAMGRTHRGEGVLVRSFERPPCLRASARLQPRVRASEPCALPGGERTKQAPHSFWPSECSLGEEELKWNVFLGGRQDYSKANP